MLSFLSCVGAERFLSNMVKYWAEAGHRVTALIFDSGDFVSYLLSKSIHWQALNISCQSNSWIDELIDNLKCIHILCKIILQSKSVAYTHTKDTKRIFFEIPLVTLKFVPQNM